MIENDDGTVKFETVDEFIKSVMGGDEYLVKEGNGILRYNNSFENPFRWGNSPLVGTWNIILEKSFVLVKPKPIIERRYRLLLDNNDGVTSSTGNYYSEVAMRFLVANGWYPHPTDFIDVEL